MGRKLLMTIFALGIAAVVYLSLSTSTPGPVVDNTLSDYWQRHPMEGFPVTGGVAAIEPGGYLSDYAARHAGMTSVASSVHSADMTDYAARQTMINSMASSFHSTDMTDYAARHPELTNMPIEEADTTDYYFRHRADG